MSKPPKDILQLPLEKRAEIAFKIAVAKALDELWPSRVPSVHLAQRQSSQVVSEKSAQILKIEA